MSKDTLWAWAVFVGKERLPINLEETRDEARRNVAQCRSLIGGEVKYRVKRIRIEVME